jgi:D-amino-acid dehydrogenase
VLDRQPAAALETSFANGGQISVSHAEPWVNPRMPHCAHLAWMRREDAPLLFRLRWDAALLDWSAALSARVHGAANACQHPPDRQLWPSTAERQLQALRAETSLTYDQLERGILHLYTDRQGVRCRHRRGGADASSIGCERRPVSVDECVAIEPALARRRGRCSSVATTRRRTSPATRTASRSGSRVHLCGAPVSIFRYGVAVDRLTRLPVAGCRGRHGRRRGCTRPTPTWSRSAVTPLCCCARSASACRSTQRRVTRPLCRSRADSLAPTVSLIDDASQDRLFAPRAAPANRRNGRVQWLPHRTQRRSLPAR